VRTEHRPNDVNRPTTPRCFRHTVWMAYCGDCREANAPLLRKRRETDAAPDTLR
jgi:hypothetical protein